LLINQRRKIRYKVRQTPAADSVGRQFQPTGTAGVDNSGISACIRSGFHRLVLDFFGRFFFLFAFDLVYFFSALFYLAALLFSTPQLPLPFPTYVCELLFAAAPIVTGAALWTTVNRQPSNQMEPVDGSP